jgi:uncharacterized protein (DUF1778 family)
LESGRILTLWQKQLIGGKMMRAKKELKTLTISLPRGTKEILSEAAKNENRSLSNYLINAGLERFKEKQKK